MRILFTCLLLLSGLLVHAQNDLPDSTVVTPKKKAKNYYGVRFGGLASNFSHSSGNSIPSLSNKSMLSWHAGLSADFFTQPYYNARLELSYISKGAKETFGNDRINIGSTNRLQYLQLNVLPLIVKPGFRKINPYIALGGYYAKRVGIKSRWKPGNNAAWEEDVLTANNLNVTQDYGYSVSLGIYVWRRPLFEIRYEGGIPSVSSTSKIRNRSILFSISI